MISSSSLETFESCSQQIFAPNPETLNTYLGIKTSCHGINDLYILFAFPISFSKI